ncbi:hypothetical protein DFH29DRAFT_871446 [Suillus ampliporus]|nr:hypothetical protein DFH29DRAFT_871446 [Suillus ampliporus]
MTAQEVLPVLIILTALTREYVFYIHNSRIPAPTAESPIRQDKADFSMMKFELDAGTAWDISELLDVEGGRNLVLNRLGIRRLHKVHFRENLMAAKFPNGEYSNHEGKAPEK